MTATPFQHGWSSEAFFNKALIYVGEMERYTPGDWQLGFWAGLSIEFIARAALAHVSPTLLADRKNWRNVYHALGHPPTAKEFVPVSIAITEVLSILKEILPTFTKELHDSCIKQCGQRNAELHSGEAVFAEAGKYSWLPEFYASCRVLLQSMDMALCDLFSEPKLAEDMITSMQDKAAKSVQQDINIHKQLWAGKNEDERKKSLAQSATWATSHAGHRTECPACGSPALVRGSRQGPVTTEVGEDRIVQKQTALPSSFECIGCGLKISGLSKLSACGLGDPFTATSTLSPAEFFGLYTEEDLEQARAEFAEPEWEEDFNE